MKTWRKGLALLLVGMMMMSGLVALSAPAVVADTNIGTQNRFTIVYNDTIMYDELVYEVDPDGSYYLLGEEDNTIDVTIEVLMDWVFSGNMTLNNGNNITHVWLNLTDGGWDSDVFHVDETNFVGGDDMVLYNQNWNNTVNQTGNTFVGSWDFDTLKQTGLGVDMDENYFDLTLEYMIHRANSGLNWSAGQPVLDKISNTLKVYIYFHSIFDDPAGDDNIPFGADPQLMDVTAGENANGFFEAGDKFAETQLTVYNYDGTAITELTCTITPDAGTGVTLSNGLNYCTVMNIGANNYTILNYRTDVAEQTPPGIKDGTAVIVYTRDDSGLEITESTVHDIEWWVDFSFRTSEPYTPPNQPAGDPTTWSPFQCTATSVVILNDTRQVDYVAEYGVPQIEQSTYTDQLIRMAINVTNNGNTPIYNVQFRVDPGSGFAPTGWDFFRNPRFFWQNVNPAGPLPEYDTISQMFTEIGVNETVTVTIEMVIAANVPIGVHRLPLSYDGFYFNGGELEEATGYFGINGGDGIANGVNDLTLIFAIEVVDTAIACHIGAVTPGSAGDKDAIIHETITVTIINDEMYRFIDVTVRANFTGTPWYNPIIGMSGDRAVWANQANPSTPYVNAWAPGVPGQMSVTFTVDTDPNMTPDRYPFTLEITAVIEQNLEVVSVVVDWTQGAVIDYEGYGPQIQISAFANTDIVPGQGFNMTLTIENVGDETLRDVWVWVDSDTTEEYDWDFEKDFKDQFDWSSVFEDWGSETGGQVTWNGEFPEDMFYTMESLDVDNIREIVEINLYAEGVFSIPGPTINLIKIIDLAPGDSFDVTFDMFADKDMVNGKPYAIYVDVWGTAPNGNTIYPDESLYVTVMSSLPGETYNPVELNWFDAGLKALALFLFFIIVLAILLFVYNMFKGEPYDDDEEDFDFEDEPFEPELMEPAPAPEAPQEELVEP